MFVDGPDFFLVLAQLNTEGNILTKFQKNPTSGFGGDATTRNVYRRTVGRTDGRRRGHRPQEKLLWRTDKFAKTTYSRRAYLSSLIRYKIFDVVPKLWQAKGNEAKTFRFFFKGLFFKIQLKWLNLHVLEAYLPEKHAFIVCKAFKTIHILKSLCTSINIWSHTCDMLSSRTAVCCF